MNPIIISIFGINIRWYSVILLSGIIIGIILLMREGKKYHYSKDFLFNLAFWVIIFGFIGARLYYVLFNYKMYLNNPISILKVWEGGLAIHGGIIFGFITLALYCKKYNARIFKVTDMAAVPLLLAQAIGRWGNFFNGEAHGGITSLISLQDKHIPEFIINGMNINGVYYEPTFFYESLWCLLGVLVLVVLKKYKYLKVGGLTGAYMIWYGVGRFFIESLRTDSLMFGGFKVAQIVSVILVLLGTFITLAVNKKSKFEDLYVSEKGENIIF